MKEEILNSFYEKWNFINTDKEKFSKFKERVNAVLIDYLGDKLSNEEVIREFRIINGTKYIINNSIGSMLKELVGNSIKDYKNIYEILMYEEDIKKYMFYIQAIFLIDSISLEDKKKLCDNLKKVIDISGFRNIVYLDKLNDEFKVLPVGEKFLDDNLMIESIKALEGYENAYNLYIASLQQYTFSENGIVENRDIADKLRLSYETYLKKRFNSNEKKIGGITKKDVGEFFNDNNISPFICNIYKQLASAFEQYSNEDTKHNLKEISSEELEYLIYLFGTFVRLIYRIDKRNKINSKS